MIDTNAFLGLPISFGKICKIYPPKLSEILINNDYPVYRKLLLISQEEIEDEFTEQKLPFDKLPNPLEYLCEFAKQDERIKKIIAKGFEFFIKEPVIVLPEQKMVIIGDLENVILTAKSLSDFKILNEKNYFEFQNKLRVAIGEKEIEPYNENENPRIKYFKAKARLRDKIKAKSKDGISLGTTLASICCMGIGITPLNVGELTQAAVTILTRYYQEKNKYEIDIQSLLAGADSKKVKPQFWIRNLEDL